MSLAKALLEVQKELPAIEPDAVNPHFKNKYVSLDRLLAVTLPILNKHGVVLTQAPSTSDRGVPMLATILFSADDYEDQIRSTMPLLLEKENSQGLGSAITYGRRQMLAAMLGVSGEKDDDGEAASTPAAKKKRETAVTATEKQRQWLAGIAKEADAKREAAENTTWNEIQQLCTFQERHLTEMSPDEIKQLGGSVRDYADNHAKPDGITYYEHMTAAF